MGADFKQNQAKNADTETDLANTALPSYHRPRYGFLSRLGNRLAIGLAGAALSLGALPKNADACLMLDGTNDADYKALATQFQGQACWVNVVFDGGSFTASGVRLTDTKILTCAHVVYSDRYPTNSAITIGTGLNFKTDPGETRSAYTDVLLYPGYNDASGKVVPDLAILTLTEPISGPAIRLGTALEGEVVYSSGYGMYGTPSTGLLPQDGYARAWEAKVHSSFMADLNPVYYNGDSFGYGDGLPLNGRGATFDSGSPVFNGLGELVGINKAVGGSASEAESLGMTYYVDLFQPEVYSWIEQNTGVPEPASLALLGLGGAALLRRRRAVENQG